MLQVKLETWKRFDDATETEKPVRWDQWQYSVATSEAAVVGLAADAFAVALAVPAVHASCSGRRKADSPALVAKLHAPPSPCTRVNL